MNPTVNTANSRYQMLNQLSSALDEIIACQREEQDAILNRQTKLLPIINAKVNQLMVKVEGFERALSPVWPGRPLPEEWDAVGKSCLSKLKELQELALQNHLLLENSLRFLQEVFKEVLGASEQPTIYDHLGMMPLGVGGGSGKFLSAQA